MLSERKNIVCKSRNAMEHISFITFVCTLIKSFSAKYFLSGVIYKTDKRSSIVQHLVGVSLNQFHPKCRQYKNFGIVLGVHWSTQELNVTLLVSFRSYYWRLQLLFRSHVDCVYLMSTGSTW